MKPAAIALALALLAPGPGAGLPRFQAGQQNVVPVREEPRHHLVLDNGDVRAYDVVVPAGQSTLFHLHALDYVYVVLGEATLKSEVLGEAPADLPVHGGEVRFTPGPVTHRVTFGTTPFHNITVEMVRPRSQSPRALPALAPGAPETVVLDNDRVRVTRVVLQPAEATPARSLPARTLTVPLNAGTVRLDTAGRPARTIELEAGKAEWNGQPLDQATRNLGRAAITIVYIELK